MKPVHLFLVLILLTTMACTALQVGIQTATPTLSHNATLTSSAMTATSPSSATTLTASPSPALPASPTPSPAAAASATPSPAAQVATSTPAVTASRTASPAPSLTPVSQNAYPYLDDRSTATGVIQSLFNAINRKEFARAYSYWDSNNTGNNHVAPFATFEQGYATTHAIQVKIGPVFHDEGAGQYYYSIGVLLKATQDDGTTQTYTACYNMHLGSPGAQAIPPFVPLLIEDGQASLAPSGSSDQSLLIHSCDGIARAAQPYPTAPITNTQDISNRNYLDDRSDPALVLSSMFNAINRLEYVRAYSYWEMGSVQTPPFTQFQSGYASTASVVLTTGKVSSSGAAGSMYYTVPTVIVAHTSTGVTQTYAGCYILRLGDPLNQTVPPFAPMAIHSASVKSYPNSSDHAALLAQACQGQ